MSLGWRVSLTWRAFCIPLTPTTTCRLRARTCRGFLLLCALPPGGLDRFWRLLPHLPLRRVLAGRRAFAAACARRTLMATYTYLSRLPARGVHMYSRHCYTSLPYNGCRAPPAPTTTTYFLLWRAKPPYFGLTHALLLCNARAAAVALLTVCGSLTRRRAARATASAYTGGVRLRFAAARSARATLT